MMAIKEKEDELFKKWAKKRQGFVSDGVIDEDSYLLSKIKVLYILKEVNDIGGGDWDLREFVKNGARARTWNNITRWTIGINNIEKEIPWIEIETITDEQRKEHLKGICAVNLKKSPGDYVCNGYDLYRVAEEDASHLKEQIALYDADLIICCGTSDIYHSIFQKSVDWKRTNKGIWYYEFKKNKYLISYVHPEARISPNIPYYGLMDAIKEIKGIN